MCRGLLVALIGTLALGAWQPVKAAPSAAFYATVSNAAACNFLGLSGWGACAPVANFEISFDFDLDPSRYFPNTQTFTGAGTQTAWSLFSPQDVLLSSPYSTSMMAFNTLGAPNGVDKSWLYRVARFDPNDGSPSTAGDNIELSRTERSWVELPGETRHAQYGWRMTANGPIALQDAGPLAPADFADYFSPGRAVQFTEFGVFLRLQDFTGQMLDPRGLRVEGTATFHAAPVPEPESYALLVAGLLLIVLRRATKPSNPRPASSSA